MRYLALTFLLTGCLFHSGPMPGGEPEPGEMSLEDDSEAVFIVALGDMRPAAPGMDEDMGTAGMGGQAADVPQDEADTGGDGDGDGDMAPEPGDGDGDGDMAPEPGDGDGDGDGDAVWSCPEPLGCREHVSSGRVFYCGEGVGTAFAPPGCTTDADCAVLPGSVCAVGWWPGLGCFRECDP